jgi:hypothetical protein
VPPHHHWGRRGAGHGDGKGEGSAPAPKAEFRYLDAGRIRVTRLAGGGFRAVIDGERTVLAARFVRTFPVSHRDRFIELRDGAGGHVGMIKDPDGLDAESLARVRACLDGHYFHPVILEVRSLREAFEMQVWNVRTDRGDIEFSVSDVNRNVRQLPPRRLLITDTDHNTCEIPDWSALDLASRLRIKDIAQIVPEQE